LFAARFGLFFWEPPLNDAIVAWQQNSLEEYGRTLQRLRQLLRAAPESAERQMHGRGYPFRGQRKQRQKVSVTSPEPRTMRGKSMFNMRYGHMIKRIEGMQTLSVRLAAELEREVWTFIGMAQSNHFMLATDPAFQDTGRAPLALIRSKPGTHPFLLDPIDFFKKALLFFNGTYTVEGGGLDPMYLQMRQLERYFKFQHWAGGRPVRAPLEACHLAWEQNRRDAFTEGIMQVAEVLRGEAP
jgi:hypothetical protein